MTTSEIVNVGIYCRISDDRGGAGLGVERQRRECVALAATLGWTVTDTYIDNDISAFSGKRRPEYERLLVDLNEGRITGLITWHLDRLNRSPAELERLISILERNQVQLNSVTASALDLTTATGRALARTLGAWARFESEHKSERIRSKMLELAMAGKSTGGGHRPFGYSTDRVTIVPHEAAVICEAMRRFLDGESLTDVCRSFNARGLTTAEGDRWRANRLARILTNGRIAGWRDKPVRRGTDRYAPAEFLAPAQWPAIVSHADVARARVLNSDDTLRPGSHRRWLLSDIAVCGLCRSPLTSQLAAGHQRRYICADDNTRPSRCGRISVSHQAEQTVTDLLHAAVADGLIHRMLSDGIDVHAVVRQADRVVEGQVRQLRHDRLDARVSEAEFRRTMSHLAHVRIATRRIVAQVAVVDLAELARADFPTVWADSDMRHQRGILRALTGEISIAKADYIGAHYNPNRVTIAWRTQ